MPGATYDGKPFSTDLFDFLLKYESNLSLISSPVEKARFEQSFSGKVVEWSGEPARVEDCSSEDRAEESYIYVVNKETPWTPKKNKVAFYAYFNNASSFGKASSSRITIRGKIAQWNKFSKLWVLKECEILG